MRATNDAGGASRPWVGIEEPNADQGAGQVQQPLEDVRPPLVADAKAAAAEQPGEGSLHDPAMLTEAFGGVDPPTSDARGDAPDPECAPQGRGIVRLVGVQLGRTRTWTAWFPPRTDDGRDRVDQREQLRRVVGVSGREPNRQRDAVAIHDEVVLRSELAPVNWVTAGEFAPLLARTLSESTLARDQSTAASSPSQFSSFVCNRSQTPAACQSRSRRQQVQPLPQPSCFGSIRQEQPVRRTKTMPPRAARSGTRGRPPFGFGDSFGSSGSMASQMSSETSRAVMAEKRRSNPQGFATAS